jgi:ATP-dependent Lon protease
LFDKEKVIFFFLFNDKSKIDPILLDRMEIIEVGAYTTEDKINIVDGFLLKKIKEDIGLTAMNITISNENIIYLIEYFTHEAGVRGIERKLDKILLKLNKDRIFGSGPFEGKPVSKIDISRELIDKYLVKPNILIKKIGAISEVGMVNALFATNSGDGGILPILVYKRETGNNSKFSLKLTGKQGKTMRESVEFAFTIATNLVKSEYLYKFFDECQCGLHVHLPDSCQKDGPSAGGMFAIVFISRILHKRIKKDISLTGELERNGCLSAIGGLEFKLPGAKKAGIRLVCIPEENRKDLEKVIENQKALFDDNFRYAIVTNIKEVLDMALIEDDVNETEKDITYEKLFDHTKYLQMNGKSEIYIKPNSKQNQKNCKREKLEQISSENEKNATESSKTILTTDTEKSKESESSSTDMSK